MLHYLNNSFRRLYAFLCHSKISKTTAAYCIRHKEHIKSILFVLLIILLLEIPDILGACCYGLKKRFSNSYIQAMRIYFFIIAPLFFLPGKFGKAFFALCTAILSFCAMAVLILYHKYRLEVGGDCYLLLFNSNSAETQEFLTSLFSAYNIVVVICAVIFAIWSIYTFSRMKWKITHLHIIVGILLFLPLPVTLVRYQKEKIPLKKAFSRSSVSRFVSEYNSFRKNYGGVYDNLTKKPILPEGLTANGKNIAGIVVLGESAYRKHHSIYGYSRNTTPNLLKRKDAILPFDNVISATAQTPTAIRYLLTDEKLSNPGVINYSLPDLLKSAGYETHWISNQYAWGLGGYESSTTLLAQKCDSYYFVHQKMPGEKYDIGCIQPVKAKLNTRKPVILFVHLMGSHIAYAERYPEKFGSFRNVSDPVSDQTPQVNRRTTNAYDCSVEYTDFILEELIRILEKQQRPTFLLYVSDHSECNGLDDFKIARASNCNVRACYEIPFVFWFSREYSKQFGDFIEKGRKNLSAPLQGDHALWTIAAVAGLSWNNFPAENSLFSDTYKTPEKRSMYNREYK